MKTFYNMEIERIPLIVSGEQLYMEWATEFMTLTPPPCNDSWPFELPYYLSVVETQ